MPGLQRAVDQADHDGQDDQDCAALSGGKEACAQSDDHKNGDKHGPKRVEDGAEELFSRGAGITGALPVILVGINGADQHHAYAEHNSRHISGDPHFSHGNAGHDAVKDQRHAGRDDGGDQRGGRGDNRTEGPGIALFLHFGNQQLALQSRVRVCRTAHSAVQGAEQNVYVRKSALFMAQKAVAEIKQL